MTHLQLVLSTHCTLRLVDDSSTAPTRHTVPSDSWTTHLHLVLSTHCTFRLVDDSSTPRTQHTLYLPTRGPFIYTSYSAHTVPSDSWMIHLHLVLSTHGTFRLVDDSSTPCTQHTLYLLTRG